MLFHSTLRPPGHSVEVERRRRTMEMTLALSRKFNSLTREEVTISDIPEIQQEFLEMDP